MPLAVLWLAVVLAGAPPSPPEPHVGGRVFISPSGEPFRLGSGGSTPFDAWFDRADANHDGVLDRGEFQADAAAFFRRLDSDGDGRIDGFEISAYERKVAPELVMAAEASAMTSAGARGGPEGGPPPHRRGMEPRVGHGLYVALLNEPEPVTGADFNLDMQVTADEWRRAADRRFDLLDPGKSGRLERSALAGRLQAGQHSGRPRGRGRGRSGAEPSGRPAR